MERSGRAALPRVLDKGLREAFLRFQVALVDAQRLGLVIVEAGHAAFQALKQRQDGLAARRRGTAALANQLALQLGQLGKGARVFFFRAQVLLVQPQRLGLVRLVLAQEVFKVEDGSVVIEVLSSQVGSRLRRERRKFGVWRQPRSARGAAAVSRVGSCGAVAGRLILKPSFSAFSKAVRVFSET